MNSSIAHISERAGRAIGDFDFLKLAGAANAGNVIRKTS
jgi:hypothetical protein